jgi:Domain of unknown function (DUF4124)
MKKIKIMALCFCLSSGVLLSSVLLISNDAQAEIYKWRDKDGTIRYTDTPPPSNIKLLGRIGYKGAAGPVSVQTPPEVKGDAPPPIEAGAPKAGAEKKKSAEQSPEELEAQKKQQAELAKTKAKNCASAKANYQTYVQGGRVFRTNENGEREVLGDEQLQEGVAKAQREINENC